MARLGVTYQDIAIAANQLVEQGRQPTIELVRQILGTGSSTTIANHLRQWRVDQEGTLTLPNKENIPHEMIGMLKGLWERLSDQAGQKANEIEVKTQQEISELGQTLEKYKTNNRRWQRLFIQWQEEKENLLIEKRRLEQQVEAQQKEIDVLRTKLEAETKYLQEKRLRIEELHRLHLQSQENLKHFQATTREQRLLEHNQFEQQKVEMHHEINTLKEQLDLLQRTRTKPIWNISLRRGRKYE